MNTQLSIQGQSITSVYSGVPTVLVVDDEITSRLILEGILRKEGLRVFTSENSSQGIDLAVNQQPDLILMDVNMPGEDGLAATRKLKANPLTAHIPVVFISAQEDIELKIEGFNSGGVDYITKPYYPAEVLARARLHIRLNLAYQTLSRMHLDQLQTLTESQRLLLPKPEMNPEASYAGFYQACHHAGGDFFDVIRAGEGIFDYVIADVSGHDLGTSLPTAALKALLHQNVDMFFLPHENLTLLNRHMRSVLAEGQYATVLYMRLNRANHHLTLLNAGHPSALIIPKHGPVRLLLQNGDPIGLFETFTPGVLEMEVNPGDRLVLYSDGVIEQDQNGTVSRNKGLAELVMLGDQIKELPLGDVPEMIHQRLLPPPEQSMDDVVILVVEV